MLDGFSDALRIPTEILNVLERQASFLAEPSQSMFKLVLSIFPLEEELREEKNPSLWKPILNHRVRSLDKKDRCRDSEVLLHKDAVVLVHGER